MARYICETESYRREKIETWHKMAQEIRPDGSLRFPFAATNAECLAHMDADLREIAARIKLSST